VVVAGGGSIVGGLWIDHEHEVVGVVDVQGIGDVMAGRTHVIRVVVVHMLFQKS